MSTKKKWLLRGAVALMAGVGAMLVTPPAARAIDCYEPPGVGTCPPLEPHTCDFLCSHTYGAEGGTCFVGSGCCNCFY